MENGLADCKKREGFYFWKEVRGVGWQEVEGGCICFICFVLLKGWFSWCLPQLPFKPWSYQPFPPDNSLTVHFSFSPLSLSLTYLFYMKSSFLIYFFFSEPPPPKIPKIEPPHPPLPPAHPPPGKCCLQAAGRASFSRCLFEGHTWEILGRIYRRTSEI